MIQDKVIAILRGPKPRRSTGIDISVHYVADDLCCVTVGARVVAENVGIEEAKRIANEKQSTLTGRGMKSKVTVWERK